MSAITSVNDTTDPAPHELPAAEQPDLAELAQLYAGVVMIGNGMVTGRFPLHRTTDAGEYGFCPMSGEPVPGAEPSIRTKESITCLKQLFSIHPEDEDSEADWPLWNHAFEHHGTRLRVIVGDLLADMEHDSGGTRRRSLRGQRGAGPGRYSRVLPSG